VHRNRGPIVSQLAECLFVTPVQPGKGARDEWDDCAFVGSVDFCVLEGRTQLDASADLAEPAEGLSSKTPAKVREPSALTSIDGSSARRQSLDLGAIGNCTVAALIDRAARMVWCCYPRVDSDTIFDDLINRSEDSAQGIFAVELEHLIVCTFWYVDALVAIGTGDEARTIFEAVLACRNHVGLLSEDLDPVTGELWGNFPQSYSMVGLINSAMRLSKPWNTALLRVRD
jgi:Domain of unknown function (DUF5911)